MDSRDREVRLSQWERLYRTPYTVMVGRRLRQVREKRKLTQTEALDRAPRPNGRVYSQGFLSRIEAGYANPPLYAYVHLAEAYALDPGRVMGSDEAQKPISEAEMTLIRFLRRSRISPDEALVRLTRR
jgi:transcriptional regulator with XRE-family HTH domain